MRTLLLDVVLWDLCLDASGNIAVASNPYSQAQDAASAIRLFQGELWYNTARGIPYFGLILGKLPPAQFMKGQFIKAAMTVPGVLKVQVFLNALVGRRVTGQVQVTTEGGTSVADF